jgi:thymidylate synthase (FAD)
MITILEETTKNPITLIGKRAGVCYNSDITNNEKNYKRGLDCLNSDHGRVLEFVNVEMIIDGYSARTMREFERHHIGATFLQSSTRYIDYSKEYKQIIPEKVKYILYNKADVAMAFDNYKKVEKEFFSKLATYDISIEDKGMFLPLGMSTSVVDKRNLRSLIEMSHQRMCTRAYWEYRELFNDIINALSSYSEEWDYIVDNYFMPKCEVKGYCTENKSCGRRPTAEQLNDILI